MKTDPSEHEKLQKGEKKNETDWSAIIIVTVLSLFRKVQLTFFFSTLWPYLVEMDPKTTGQFFGFTNAVGHVMRAVCVLLFGFLSSWMGKSGFLMIIGITAVTIGQTLFIATPGLPFEPRWTIFATVVISGVGGGVTTIFRNVAVTASSSKNRSKALVLATWMNAVSATIGPSLQGVTTMIGYPGIPLLGSISLNMYTATSFGSIFINAVSIAVIIIYFREPLSRLKREYKVLPSYDKIAFLICLYTIFATTIMVMNLDTMGSLFVMGVFNMNNQEALYYTSWMKTIFGIVSSIVYIIDFFKGIVSRYSSRRMITYCLFLLILYHVVTLHWWTQQSSTTLNSISLNSTNLSFCRRSGYTWCNDVFPVDPWIYFLSFCVTLAFTLSAINVHLNTLCSKIVGPKDQAIEQGMQLLAIALARVVGSTVLTKLFVTQGPRGVWIFEIFVGISNVLLWILCYKRMIPLREELLQSYKVDSVDIP